MYYAEQYELGDVLTFKRDGVSRRVRVTRVTGILRGTRYEVERIDGVGEPFEAWHSELTKPETERRALRFNA